MKCWRERTGNLEITHAKNYKPVTFLNYICEESELNRLQKITSKVMWKTILENYWDNPLNEQSLADMTGKKRRQFQANRVEVAKNRGAKFARD